MSASSLSPVSPLATGITRLGFGALSLDELIRCYGSAEDGSQYVELDGFNVHFRDQGDPQKPPLVLIHGVASSLHAWNDWLTELAGDYRVIRFDLPGFGLTGPAKDGEYSAERVHHMLGLLLDYLNVERASIAGSSLGGYIAWTFAVQHPERVNKLILIDPVGYHIDKVPRLMAAANIPGSPLLMPVWMPKALIVQGVRELYGEPEKIKPGTLERIYNLSRRPGNRRAMIDVFRLFIHANRVEFLDVSERICTIKAPVLLMWGAQDRWVSANHVSRWQQDLPDIQVIIYAGVGHVAMEEIPQQSAADAQRFLSE